VDSDFSARFVGKRGFISVSYANGEVIESGTDGADSYTLNQMAVARKADPKAWEFGYVTSGTFPEKNLLAAQLVYIGLGSYANSQTESVSWPLEVFRKFPAQAISAEVKRAGTSPKLPEKIRWFAPDFIMYETNQLKLQEYTNGWLGAEFSAKSWTNYRSLTLPTALELRTYRPKRGLALPKPDQSRAREDVELVTTTTATITSFSVPEEGLGGLPALSQHVTVQDWRFKDQIGPDPLPYAITNARWPTVANLSLKELVAQRKGTAPRLAPPNKLVVVIIMTLCSSPLLLILWWRRKRNIPISIQQEN
jgi:hypothetical protein